jgi:hypothetical protein
MILAASLWGLAIPASAQDLRYGAPIPAVHRTLFEKGLGYLVESQQRSGSWGNTGVTAICVMALLASGEDPNFGRYADTARAGVRSMIRQQDGETGFIRSGMYEHGFAMLALADSYGAVDERLLWKGEEDPGRSIGEALELAVRCAVTSQENNAHGAWRYSPDGVDADTSAAGAVLMGLLGARNAGISVPDHSIDTAVEYFTQNTMKNGLVNYSSFGGMGDSYARSAICTLVLSIAKRKDSAAFQATQQYLTRTWDALPQQHPAYTLYYRSQALFQANYPLWRRWTEENTVMLAELQLEDGSIPIQGSSNGLAYQTGMALLSAGLNYCLLPIYER